MLWWCSNTHYNKVSVEAHSKTARQDFFLFLSANTQQHQYFRFLFSASEVVFEHKTRQTDSIKPETEERKKDRKTSKSRRELKDWCLLDVSQDLVACVQTNLINYSNLRGRVRLARQELKCQSLDSLHRQCGVGKEAWVSKAGEWICH